MSNNYHDSRPRYNQKEQLGLSRARSLFIEKFCWIFRGWHEVDLGIDAEFEIAHDGFNTGEKGELQIKSGSSYFPQSQNYYTYYADEYHYHYWTSLRNPVFLIGILDDGNIIWQYISQKQDYEKLNKSYAVRIPLDQILTVDSKAQIENIIRTHKSRFNTVDHHDPMKLSTDGVVEEITDIISNSNNCFSISNSVIEAYVNSTTRIKDLGEKSLTNNPEKNQRVLMKLIDKYRSTLNELANNLLNQYSYLSTQISQFEILTAYLINNLDEFRNAGNAYLKYRSTLETFVNALDRAKASFASIRQSIEEQPDFERESFDTKEYQKSKENACISLHFTYSSVERYRLASERLFIAM